jgi:hypothetical protein
LSRLSPGGEKKQHFFAKKIKNSAKGIVKAGAWRYYFKSDERNYPAN